MIIGYLRISLGVFRTVYLVGGMENEKGLGAKWREDITPRLLDMDFKVLNPCQFEPEQLKGKQTNRLPKKIKTYDGKIIKPRHWHELKKAPVMTSYHKRFRSYMSPIIHFDLDVVSYECDFLICNWTKGAAAGGGTHAEVSLAHKLGKEVYMVVQEGVQVPGWIQGCVTENGMVGSFDELFETLEKRVGKTKKAKATEEGLKEWDKWEKNNPPKKTDIKKLRERLKGVKTTRS